MRRLLCLLAALLPVCATPLLSQTKIDLGSQVKGQLPAGNAQAVIAAAGAAAVAAGNALTFGGTAHAGSGGSGEADTARRTA